jgi:hypothetical protein
MMRSILGRSRPCARLAPSRGPRPPPGLQGMPHRSSARCASAGGQRTRPSATPRADTNGPDPSARPGLARHGPRTGERLCRAPVRDLLSRGSRVRTRPGIPAKRSQRWSPSSRDTRVLGGVAWDGPGRSAATEERPDARRWQPGERAAGLRAAARGGKPVAKFVIISRQFA